MRQRLISAAVLVPVVVLVFLAGQPWLTFGIAILAILAAWETTRLIRLAGLPAVPWVAISAPLLAVFAFESVLRPGGIELGSLLLAPGLALWLMAAALPALRDGDPRSGLLSWVGTLFAGLYPSLLAFLVGVLWLKAFDTPHLADGVFSSGRAWLLVLVATVWSLDSAAYLAGRYHGRGRFMNHISPNKTWSGVVGGTITGVVVCTALVTMLLRLEPWLGAFIGLVVAISAQAGDLAESMLKRAAGAKDSGNLIPGHGGVLDRLDSLLFAAPALYSILVIGGLLGLGGLR